MIRKYHNHILQTNLRRCEEEPQIQVELSHFDVIALSESWLWDKYSTDESLFIIRKDRVEISHGGVII